MKKISTFLAVAVKAPKLLKLLKVVKLMKFAKPVITMVTIVISLCAYAIIYNPWIAVGLVAVLFVHEMGHVIAMNKEGFKTSGPVFIPFLGAALFAPKDMNRRQEAVIGIGGPILGSLFSFLLIGLYFLFEAKWLLIMGYMGIFLNLFNMIPISPLDGGRVTQAVGKYFKFIGLAMLIAVTIALKSPGILLIWIIVLFDIHMLSIKTRFVLALVVEIAMITMVATGIGITDNSIFWTTIIDCTLGGAYLTAIGLGIGHNAEALQATLDEHTKRPALSAQNKVKWLLVWSITFILLYVTLLLLEPSIKIILVS